jgi:hypothetical protein
MPRWVMNKSLRFRFWVEAMLGTLTGVLFAVTMVSREWIEVVFGVDPDGGDGSVEVGILGGLLVATVASWMYAGAERRRVVSDQLD